MIEPETPSEHFSSCGPFCTHVKMCRQCADVFGLCAKHRNNPGGTFSWRKQYSAEAIKERLGFAPQTEDAQRRTLKRNLEGK